MYFVIAREEIKTKVTFNGGTRFILRILIHYEFTLFKL